MSDHPRQRASDVVTAMQWVTRIGAALAAIGVIASAIAWAADTTYARKTEVQQAVSGVVQELRKSQAEDKIFEISLIPPEKRTDVQRAMLDRYNRELRELERKAGK